VGDPLNLIIQIIFGEEYRLLSCLWSRYSPQHPVLKHPNPHSSLNVADQVSHPQNNSQLNHTDVPVYISAFFSLLGDKRTNDEAGERTTENGSMKAGKFGGN
jgi:hypothetical protein